MSLHPIEEVLSPLGNPVARMRYVGDAPTYIVYSLLGQTGQLYAEGNEAETAVSYAVSIFSPGSSPALMTAAKAALEAAGWIAEVDMEYYDFETDRYQATLTVRKEGGIYG